MVRTQSYVTAYNRKMKKRAETPRSRVRSALRQLWLRSRERAATIKRDGYRCQDCGIKQSVAKGREVRIEVDHLDGIDWEAVIDIVIERILVNPARLQTVCKPCHYMRTLTRKL